MHCVGHSVTLSLGDTASPESAMRKYNDCESLVGSKNGRRAPRDRDRLCGDTVMADDRLHDLITLAIFLVLVAAIVLSTRRSGKPPAQLW